SWIRRAVESVCDDLITSKNQTADVGPLYHAVDGLKIYYMRVKPKTDVTSTARDVSQNSGSDAGGE
ncbi:MAG: hypothetical protein O2955_08525, partial [Planctomycetota bacterium]|nr:hypothetical protein [Planctomycetota bacterium]